MSVLAHAFSNIIKAPQIFMFYHKFSWEFAHKTAELGPAEIHCILE